MGKKRPKTSIRRGPDLISSLPDKILHHILGFMKTKDAVQTCVLSKRWKHLWPSLRSLHFDIGDFDCDEGFVEFVNAVLLQREPLDLDEFHLCCPELDSEYDKEARDWIHYAVKHHTRVFHLLDCYYLPSYIYTCTSIEELHLIRCKVHTRTANLPKLKTLIMHCYNNNNEDTTYFPENLLSGCRILECLELKCASLPDELVIANENLKHLCIYNGYTNRLLIDAPNLLSFSFLPFDLYCEHPPPHETILNTPSLMVAHFRTGSFKLSEHLEAVTSMFGALLNAELLKLHADCNQLKELHGVQLPALPISPKLKNVTVTFCPLTCFKVVAWILNSSPNLKKLTLVEQPCSLQKKRATRRESIDVSLLAAITSSKELEIIEIKYEERCSKMVRQLVDALIDAKDSENLKVHLSKLHYLESLIVETINIKLLGVR